MILKGLHHVSAITASAADNYDFYTRIMGMRLVKKTVNQDDTSVYHLFYGDERGNPGAELTFFEFPQTAQNVPGTNSISATSLRVKNDEAITWWQDRLEQFGVKHEQVTEQAARKALYFEDFEGQRLFLVSDEHDSGVPGGRPWDESTVPAAYGIIGLGPIHLTVPDAEPSAEMLQNVMGFRLKTTYASPVTGQPDIHVYETGQGGTGAEVHLEERHDLPRERMGRGGVHHVAFRVDGDDELKAWINKMKSLKIPNSGFVDRYYFRSLYFREPNGILYELATDGPGFDTDEPLEHLGESLALPPFLEGQRQQIEARLKPLDTRR